MPWPEYDRDEIMLVIEVGFPILLMIALLFSALSITRSVVHEKEARLKESMKMMGLQNYAHWTAWFVQYTLYLMVSTVVITLELVVSCVLPNSEGGVIFVFLMLFSLSSISLCFLVSTFFSTASNGAAA